MKKTLVALASMAALGAFAQSSVTMYGIIEATVDVGYKNATDTRTDAVAVGGVVTQGTTASSVTKAGFRVQDGNDQGVGTSRIGWRGTEDLGGGLKANFQLEMGLRVDDGCVTTGAGNVCSSGNSGGNLFGRNAWVGASGGFGEVRLGRQVLGSFSTQASGWSAGSSNGLYDAGSSTAPAMGGVRFSNAIRYITPNISGLTGSVMLAAPENTASFNNGVPGAGNITTSSKPKTGVDLALDYANGPLYLGFGYNQNGNSTANSTGAPSSVSTAADVKAYTLSGSYNLGVVTPFLNYTRSKADTSAVTNPGAAVANGSSVEKAFFLGLRAPLGTSTLIAGYGTSKTTGSTVATAAGALAGSGSLSGKEKAFQLGLQYPLSKRTLLEANIGQYKNNSAARTNAVVAGALTGAATIANTAQKISSVNFGLRHTF